VSSYENIFKKKQLIIGLGVILGLSSVELNAAPSPEQTAQATSSAQAKVLKPAKKKKSANNAKHLPQLITPGQTTQELQAEQPKTSAQATPKNTAKQTGQNNQEPQAIKANKVEELGEIKVKAGRSRSLLGITESASMGVISQEQLEFRTTARPGELIELIPGMIATQHSGSGKANQYFLRGYNLDHGTDFTTIVDGIPMNLPSNAHGQGYMDLNSQIPELVDKIEFGKGPYYAEIGDFAAAGFNKMSTMKTLSQGFVKQTGGEFNFLRTVAANSSKIGEDGNLLYAAEFQTYDGAWVVPENGHKYNGVLRYSQDHDNWGVAVNAKAYTNRWTATNQQATSYLDTNGLYANISPSDMGDTNRFSYSTNLWNKGENFKNDANIYAVYYDLSLFSNMTGYLSGPMGDQINQKERRVYVGGNEEFTHFDKLFGLEMDNTYGMSFRHDEVMGLGLNQTVNRQYFNTISDDNVSESTGGLYFKNQIHWNEKLRTTQSLRADFIAMQVTSLANGYTNGNAAVTGASASSISAASPSFAAGSYEAADPALAAQINAANSGYKSKEQISPKFAAIMGPWFDTEYFLNGGYGYHSNDARGSVETMNPANQFGNNGTFGVANSGQGISSLQPGALNTSSDLSPLRQIPAMAWARGAEVGARTNYIPGLTTTAALWFLQSSSELVFNGDQGTTTANGMSNRYGFELTNYYKVNNWLTLDLDYARSYGYFVNTPQSYGGGCPTAQATVSCTGNYIPNLVGVVIAGGVQVTAPNGLYGSLRLRHFGATPLDSDGTFWAPNVDILNLGLGYKQKSYKLDFTIFNLLGETTNDIVYAGNYATSNTSNGPVNGTYQEVKHIVEPRMARAGFTVYF
jgi:hypothetical protein